MEAVLSEVKEELAAAQRALPAGRGSTSSKS